MENIAVPFIFTFYVDYGTSKIPEMDDTHRNPLILKDSRSLN